MTLDILRSWEAELKIKLASALNARSYASDEDDYGLSSIMINNWNLECDDYLREYGYTGGEINNFGKYYNTHGAVYAIYDTENMTQPEITKIIDLHVKNYTL
ncbi:MAG: hypothetical protein VX595_13350 [Pseudomonadota bacterium]|nr:hypothetical protein [Pseudomonadota bacterium]